MSKAIEPDAQAHELLGKRDLLLCELVFERRLRSHGRKLERSLLEKTVPR
jgi:hypothetical protein